MILNLTLTTNLNTPLYITIRLCFKRHHQNSHTIVSSLTLHRHNTSMSPWMIVLITIGASILIYKLLNLISKPSLPLPPGPKPWPIVGNLPHMGPVPHHALAALALKHGPLMHLRLGFVDVIVAASASVAEQFLKVHDANFSSRPPNSGAKYMAYNYQDLVFAPYGPRWRLLRKISYVHMFSSKALDDFSHIRQVRIFFPFLSFSCKVIFVLSLNQQYFSSPITLLDVDGTNYFLSQLFYLKPY